MKALRRRLFGVVEQPKSRQQSDSSRSAAAPNQGCRKDIEEYDGVKRCTTIIHRVSSDSERLNAWGLSTSRFPQRSPAIEIAPQELRLIAHVRGRGEACISYPCLDRDADAPGALGGCFLALQLSIDVSLSCQLKDTGKLIE
jgi:hypothetical protein